jgi:hypothetical protein
MRRSVVLPTIAAVVSALAGCGGAGPAPHFQAATGWHVLVEPGRSASAANVSFASGDRAESAPAGTIASLPRRGVVIWIEWVRRGQSSSLDRTYPKRALPLQVTDAADTGTPEGTRSPGAVRRLQVQGSGWNATVWIFFGAPKPSHRQVAAANSELSRFRI